MAKWSWISAAVKNPHLGNYVGAIRPAISASRDPSVDAYLFLADYHALIKNQNPDEVAQSSREIAATWLALGLEPESTYFYRQSDIPQIPELTWSETPDLEVADMQLLLNDAIEYMKRRVSKKVEFGNYVPGKPMFVYHVR